MAMASSEFSSSENTIETLRKFLQNTMRTIERLCECQALAAMQTSKLEKPDTQISYAFGVLPTSGKGFHQPSQNAMADGAGKPGGAQNWFYTSISLEERMPESKTGPPGKTNSNACSHSSETEIGNALGIFLEDMKKTIEAWCSRYHLLVGGKATSIRGGLGVEAMRQPLSSNVQVMDQLNFGPNADQDFSVMEVLDLPNDREEEGLHRSVQIQNGKVQGIPFAQQASANKGTECGTLHSQTHQSRTGGTAFSLQGFKEAMTSPLTAHNPEPLPQDMVDAQEPGQSDRHANCGQMDMKTAFANDRRPGYSNADHEDMDVEEASTHGRQQGDDNADRKTEEAEVKSGPTDQKEKKPTTEITTPVNNQELTIRRFQYKVEVVDSPKWLPKGWITEVKTRGTGGSAGSKDKYYFDPVSKRRCRSQKEVFCFLETGKLGRYKRRSKIQPVKKLQGTETPPGQQANDVGENQSANEQETPGMRISALSQQNAQENISSPLAISPGAGQMGIVSNMFLPYRPGQPSEWLVYESLANLPRPVLERFLITDPNSSKSNGDRGPTSWPWFLSNSESTMRPSVGRFEKGCKEDGPGAGQVFVREHRNTEVAPKHARKTSKKSSS